MSIIVNIYFRHCIGCNKIYGCKSEDHCLTCKSCINGQMPNNETATKKAKIQPEYTTGECPDCRSIKKLEKRLEKIEIFVDKQISAKNKHRKNNKKNIKRVKIGRL